MENLTELIKSINKTNSQTKFGDEMTLADALTERGKLWKKRLILNDLAEVATVKHDRFSRSEVKYLSIIDIKETQKEVERLSKMKKLEKYKQLYGKVLQYMWLEEMEEVQMWFLRMVVLIIDIK